MATEQIRVTPAVVKWARERAGYTVDDLISKFKKIEEWEEGRSFPSYPQLEQLADKLSLPIAVFFFPAPPDLPAISQSFRTLPATEFDRMPPRILYLLRKATAMQLNLYELNSGRNPADRLIIRDLDFPSSVSVNTMVRRVREYLAVSMDQQVGWESVEAAFENWRQALTDAGIFVFKDAFRVEGYSGFCLYDDKFPIVYVNNSTPKTRQIFSLFHELAHLIFRTSGIDTLDEHFRADYVEALPRHERRIETVCNRFAARFLLPEDVLQAALAGKKADEETAAQLAARFHVSRESIFRGFLDRGLIEQIEYERAVKTWTGERKQAAGGEYYNTQISYLGAQYINLALSQYHQNRINDLQLAEYLNIKPKNLGAFEERFARRGA